MSVFRRQSWLFVVILVLFLLWLFYFHYNNTTNDNKNDNAMGSKFKTKTMSSHDLLHLSHLWQEISGDDVDHKCKYRDIDKAIQKVAEIGREYPFLLHSPCFDEDSLGNYFSLYMEARLCADIAGLHYVAINFVHPNKLFLESHPFFQALDKVIVNKKSSQLSRVPSPGKMRELCRCSSNCHSHPNALMHSNMPTVGAVFRNAIDAYWSHRHQHYGHDHSKFLNLSGALLSSGALITPTNLSHDKYLAHKNYPVIPDVAIHYRCGDNVNALYGFVPFALIKSVIPSLANTIYIISENPYRKTTEHHRDSCNRVLDGLIRYLHVYFPTATILSIRGHDLFEDLSRLIYANTTICSPSTYCLFAAVASKTTAYYPSSSLVAGAARHLDYGSHFHWLEHPQYPVCSGSEMMDMTATELVHYLSRETVKI